MNDFERIYKQYSQQVYRLCMGYFNDPEQAKDLTQETFIAVWQNLDSFRGDASLSTWVFRIATNHCLRAVEKSRRVLHSPIPLNLPQQEELNSDDKLQFLYNCIAELEETERIIISLLLEDLPQAEIGSIVGISHGNIRVRIHRIKEKLAEKFKAHGQFE